MFRRFSVNFAIFSILLDGILLVSSLILAQEVRPNLNDFGLIKNVGEDVVLPPWLYLFFALIWIAVFLGSSLYDGRKNLKRLEELTSFSLASLLAVIASAGVLYLTYRDLSRALFLLYVFFSILGLGGWRAIYRWLGKNQQSFSRKRRVVIIGDGEVGVVIKNHIIENPEFGLEFCGFIGPEKREGVLGGYDDIGGIVTQENIDHVVIALPREDNKLVNALVGGLFETPVRVWVVPDYISLAMHEARVEEYAGVSMLDLRAPAISDYQRMTKRGFDLFVSILLLPILIPAMILIAVLIKIFDPGPILFNKVRAGENGAPFTMFKFRTMVVGADKMKSPTDGDHKQANDPRVTAIGRLLRKTSLDELPQIFNVLKGEMSLVGPRPELLEFVEEYESWQRTRFAVPPGITGWWQVNGRSDRPMHLHTEDDLYYIKHYSIWLDFQILVRTAWVVVVGRGAY